MKPFTKGVSGRTQRRKKTPKNQEQEKSVYSEELDELHLLLNALTSKEKEISFLLYHTKNYLSEPNACEANGLSRAIRRSKSLESQLRDIGDEREELILKIQAMEGLSNE